LAAVALPVLRRAEDALAEEPVALGLQRAVVDRFRLGDLAGRPVANLLARREPDTDRVEIIDVDQVLSAPSYSSISTSARSASPRGPTSASTSSSACAAGDISTSSRSPSAPSAGSVSSWPVSSTR